MVCGNLTGVSNTERAVSRDTNTDSGELINILYRDGNKLAVWVTDFCKLKQHVLKMTAFPLSDR